MWRILRQNLDQPRESSSSKSSFFSVCLLCSLRPRMPEMMSSPQLSRRSACWICISISCCSLRGLPPLAKTCNRSNSSQEMGNLVCSGVEDGPELGRYWRIHRRPPSASAPSAPVGAATGHSQPLDGRSLSFPGQPTGVLRVAGFGVRDLALTRPAGLAEVLLQKKVIGGESIIVATGAPSWTPSPPRDDWMPPVPCSPPSKHPETSVHLLPLRLPLAAYVTAGISLNASIYWH